MNNIVLDFRHNYIRGERLESQEIVYQYDSGRVIEAYVPTTESSFFLHVGFANDETLSVITIDSVTEDQEEGGYKILATIPDSIIARWGDMLVYVVAAGSNQLVTTYEGVVPVRHKPVAEDYIVPDEEATSIIERAEAAAGRAESAQAAAEAAAAGSVVNLAFADPNNDGNIVITVTA
jgi:hypothetical protein